uniref:Peptide chain release factor 2 n=1 Tax=Arundo donax TaxID=35708 RepID=A0A0A9EIA8_ARUDO
MSAQSCNLKSLRSFTLSL